MNRIARGIARDIALSTWKCTQVQDKACTYTITHTILLANHSYYTVLEYDVLHIIILQLIKAVFHVRGTCSPPACVERTRRKSTVRILNSPPAYLTWKAAFKYRNEQQNFHLPLDKSTYLKLLLLARVEWVELSSFSLTNTISNIFSFSPLLFVYLYLIIHTLRYIGFYNVSKFKAIRPDLLSNRKNLWEKKLKKIIFGPVGFAIYLPKIHLPRQAGKFKWNTLYS